MKELWCYKNIEGTILFWRRALLFDRGTWKVVLGLTGEALIPYFIDSGTEVGVGGMISYELR